MKRFKYLLPCVALAFFSCSQEDGTPQTDNASIAMAVKTEISGSSRNMITDVRSPYGAQLGITLVDNKENVFTYDGLTDGYFNVRYDAKGNYPDQVWTAYDEPIYLSATDGRAVAYYPYSEEDGADFRTLPVKAAGQTDYMYSKWVKPINSLDSEALFKMQHAMAGIRVSIISGSYTGQATVSEIRLSSTALGVTGTLDASTGTISGAAAGEINTYMMRPAFASFDVSEDDYTSTLLMGVPVAGVKDDLTISIKVDGHLYQVKGLMTQPFQSGTLYTFKLTLDNTALSVDEKVTITPWVEDDTASTDNGGVLSPVNS